MTDGVVRRPQVGIFVFLKMKSHSLGFLWKYKDGTVKNFVVWFIWIVETSLKKREARGDPPP